MIFITALQNNLDTFKLLIKDARLDLNAKDYLGLTAKDWSRMLSHNAKFRLGVHAEFAKFEVNESARGVRPMEIHMAACSHNVTWLRSVIKSGADINQPVNTIGGEITPLILAVATGK